MLTRQPGGTEAARRGVLWAVPRAPRAQAQCCRAAGLVPATELFAAPAVTRGETGAYRGTRGQRNDGDQNAGVRVRWRDLNPQIWGPGGDGLEKSVTPRFDCRGWEPFRFSKALTSRCSAHLRRGLVASASEWLVDPFLLPTPGLAPQPCDRLLRL